MISARFSLNNPDQMEATIRLTMTVGQIRELRKVLLGLEHLGYPGDCLMRVLTDVIYEAEKNFVAHAEEAKP